MSIQHSGATSFWKKVLESFGDRPVTVKLHKRLLTGTWIRLEPNYGEFEGDDGQRHIIEFGDVLGCKEDR